MKLNIVKLVILITIVNIISWLLLEWWIVRYSDGAAEGGAGVMVFFQIVMYLVSILLSSIQEVNGKL